ncbi:MAG: anhydro-N-acetylmuramic acid kinase [Planctomycetota bacterium]|nr:anhydro-N-acetylmuramic acid kinase [Planctomycetota bacterium]
MSSGTSADSVDMALVRISGRGQQREVSVECSGELTFATELQDAVHHFVAHYDQPLAPLDKKLALFFGDCVNIFLRENGVAVSEVDCVASHGQTVFHHDGDPRQGSLQLGDLQTIADRCGVSVIGDFRQADLHAGGQGAPISVFSDWVLHSDGEKECAILNLGGIANISYLRHSEPPLAWDCGPANGPLDALMRLKVGQHCDIDGKLALSGTVNHELYQLLTSNPYFSKTLPKSTGLELFGSRWLAEICNSNPQLLNEDILATLCSVAAYGVSSSLVSADLAPSTIYLCGGGRHNRALVKALRSEMPKVVFGDYSQLGFDADLREAIAFALLADAKLLGECSTWPSTTGAVKPSVLGNVVHSRT